MRNYNSCCAEPALSEVDDCCPTIEVIPPNELHIMLGIVNYIIHLMRNKGLEVEKWTKTLSCYPEGRGSEFNGNSAKKLLENADSLKIYLPLEMHYFVHILIFFFKNRQFLFWFSS